MYKLNVTTTKVFRLGKKRENSEQSQHRPLLVSLEKESDKNMLLARSGQLRHHDKYKEIYFAPDKTKFERSKHRKLVDELKQKRARGETDLIIRNGSIVTKRPHSQPAVVTVDNQPGSNGSNEIDTQI